MVNAAHSEVAARFQSAAASLPPGPRGPAIWHMGRLFTRPFDFLTRCGRDYGDIFTIRSFGDTAWVLTSSPELSRAIFTADPAVLLGGTANAAMFGKMWGKQAFPFFDGPKHAERRRIHTPAFAGEGLNRYGELTYRISRALIEKWPKHTTMKMLYEMRTLLKEVIFRAVFGLDQGAGAERLKRMLSRLLAVADSPIIFLRPLQQDWGPSSPWGRIMRLVRETSEALLEEIASRRVSSLEGGDVLSLLLKARDSEGHALSDVELHDEVMAILVAGHETTSTGLSWCFEYLLAYREVYERARAEAMDAFGTGGEYDPSAKLTYITAVVYEVLRLRSPMIIAALRDIAAPFTLGGYTLPVGARVMVSPYNLHFRPDIYPDPETFRPERFLGTRPDPYAWAPFGGGAHRCIGMALALLQMRIVIAAALTQVQLTLRQPLASPVLRAAVHPKHGTEVVRTQ